MSCRNVRRLRTLGKRVPVSISCKGQSPASRYVANTDDPRSSGRQAFRINPACKLLRYPSSCIILHGAPSCSLGQPEVNLGSTLMGIMSGQGDDGTVPVRYRTTTVPFVSSCLPPAVICGDARYTYWIVMIRSAVMPADLDTYTYVDTRIGFLIIPLLYC